jgi:hypothetical protein
MAASATFALKAGASGVLVLAWVSPDSQVQRARRQAETPPIVLSRFPRRVAYHVVAQVKRKTSVGNAKAVLFYKLASKLKRRMVLDFVAHGRHQTGFTDRQHRHQKIGKPNYPDSAFASQEVANCGRLPALPVD